MRASTYSPRAAATGFVPALEGMRALAAIGVMTTHVAFQTAESTGSLLNRVWGRFDLWVAVFFALSGFLLWRRHARRARLEAPEKGGQRWSFGQLAAPDVIHYYRSRAVRILPAYLVMALVALLVLRANADLGVGAWLANLLLVQVYVPGALVDGLTHAWSLSVEATFYVVLPALWLALSRLRGRRARWRVPLIAAVAVVSLGWAFVPWHELGLPDGLNDHILPPAFASWFAAGMLLAEFTVAPPRLLAAACSRPWHRWAWWAVAAVCFMTTTSRHLYTEGFVHATAVEFAGRTASGAVIAFCLLAPIALAPAGARFRLLAAPPMLALGRWSYGIFLWHMVVLQLVFAVLGVSMFGGSMALVWVATLLVTVVIAAASYAWVEEPARRAWAGHTYEPARPGPERAAAKAPRANTTASAETTST